MRDFTWTLIIINLLFTIVIYGMFPIGISLLRKKSIKLKTYNSLCFAINFIIATVLHFFTNSDTSNSIGHSFAPCFIWTSVFVSIGFSILKKKNSFQDGSAETNIDRKNEFIDPKQETNESIHNSIVQEQQVRTAPKMNNDTLYYCWNCGEPIDKKIKFCPKCGSKVSEETITEQMIPESRPRNPDSSYSGNNTKKAKTHQKTYTLVSIILIASLA